MSPEVALRDILRRRASLVAFRSKRTTNGRQGRLTRSQMTHMRHRRAILAAACQAEGDRDGVAQTYARPRRANRSLGETDAARASELLRRLGQPPEHVVVLQSGPRALAQGASAPEPERRSILGALHQPRRSLLSANQDTTPVALSPFRRQNPREEPGALAALAGICAGCALQAR